MWWEKRFLLALTRVQFIPVYTVIPGEILDEIDVKPVEKKKFEIERVGRSYCGIDG